MRSDVITGAIRVTAILLPVMTLGCGAGTFRIDKDSMTTYFGRQDSTLSRSLCASGDLVRILSDAAIPQKAKEDFFRYQCTDERSREQVVSLYGDLSREEQRELKDAFIRQGYKVNRPNC